MLGLAKRNRSVEEHIQRVLIILAIAIGVFMNANMFGTSHVYAQSDSFNYNCGSYCYDIEMFRQSTNWTIGAEAYNTVRGISAGDGHLSNEIWLIDDHTYSGETDWVETGYFIATQVAGQGCAAYTEEFFWADQRHTSGYNAHCFTPVGSGDYGHDVIDNVRRSTSDHSYWIVTITPYSTSLRVGTSTSNIMYPNRIDIGEELFGTNSASGPKNEFHNNRYNALNGSWVYFSGSTPWNQIGNNPPWVGWNNGEDPTKDSTGGVEYTCSLPGSSNPC